MNESFIEQEINKKEDGNYQSILDELRNILKSHFFNSDNLVEIFDNKFNKDDVIQLLDENGEALLDMKEKRIEPVPFEKIDRHNKEVYIRGMLYSFSLNPINLIEKLSKEKALLDIAEREGSQLKKLVLEYQNN